MRLPTDGVALSAFLDRIEGRTSGPRPVRRDRRGLLVMDQGKQGRQVILNYDVVDESFFSGRWPSPRVVRAYRSDFQQFEGKKNKKKCRKALELPEANPVSYRIQLNMNEARDSDLHTMNRYHICLIS